MYICNMIDYATYTNMPSVPAGVILDRIIHEKKRTKVDVATNSHLIPQRLNDLIKGRRRFTPQISMMLEHCLDIDIIGFFYLIQAKHDIYEEQKSINMRTKPDLSKLTKTTFWDVDVNRIDWTNCMKWAIRRVLEYGSNEEIREIAKFYGEENMKQMLSEPSNFRLYEIAQRNFKESGL